MYGAEGEGGAFSLTAHNFINGIAPGLVKMVRVDKPVVKVAYVGCANQRLTAIAGLPDVTVSNIDICTWGDASIRAWCYYLTGRRCSVARRPL